MMKSIFSHSQTNRLGAALALSLMVSTLPSAAIAQDFTPDVIELEGSETLAFPPAPQLDVSQGGAIEFWIAPDWEGTLDYDPPVLINIGEGGISYLVSVLRGRDGIAFSNADEEAVFVADLSDGQLHHIAINIMDDGLVVYVDGKVVGTSQIMPMALPSSGLFIGGLDIEGANVFRGAIGQLRIWAEPLFEEDIKEYRLRDVLEPSGEDHPDIANLKAFSDFEAGELQLVESVEDLP